MGEDEKKYISKNISIERGKNGEEEEKEINQK